MKVLLVVMLLFPFFGFSQQYRNAVVDNGMIYSMESRPSGPIGTVYLNDDWKEAVVILKSGAVSGTEKFVDIPVKLDLKTHAFDISTDKGVRVLPGSKVSRFEWFNSFTRQKEVYINCDKFSLDGTKLIGFCKVLSDSGLMLVERPYIDVIKANYNVQMNVGSKEDRLVKKEKLYLIKDDKMIPYEKKVFFSMLGDKADVVKRYVKENKLNISNQDELKLVVDYYNSI